MKPVDVKLGWSDVNGVVMLPLTPVCKITKDDSEMDIVIRCKFGPYKTVSPMFNCYKINDENPKSVEGSRVINVGSTFTIEIGL